MRSFLFIAGLLLGLTSSAQQYQLWAGYYNSIKVNNRFTVNSDLQLRTTEWYRHLSQVLARTGLTYKLSSHFAATAGFADFAFFSKDRISKNEYRPWEELSAQLNAGSYRITQRLRIEQRIFQHVENETSTAAYNFNHRFRYRIDLLKPLHVVSEERRTDLQLGNEIMLNAGDVKSYFDQNRTWLGLQYTLNRHIALQLQYVFILQQTSSHSAPEQIHVIRFNVYHTIFAYDASNTTK